MAFLCQIGKKLGKKSSKMIDISNKNPVKDYGKPKTLPSAKYCTQIYFINLAHEQIY